MKTALIALGLGYLAYLAYGGLMAVDTVKKIQQTRSQVLNAEIEKQTNGN